MGTRWQYGKSGLALSGFLLLLLGDGMIISDASKVGQNVSALHLPYFTATAAYAFNMAEDENDTRIARGRVIFQKNGCFVCHGVGGVGGVRNKNAITAEEIVALTYVGEGFDEDEVKEKLITGVPMVDKLVPWGPIPPLAMPSFEERMTEEELDDLVGYLMNLMDAEPEPQTPRPPVPDFMLGEGNCRVCHRAVLNHFKESIHIKNSRDERVQDNPAMVCNTCHGPGDAHARNPSGPKSIRRFGKTSPIPVEEQIAACLRCHEEGLKGKGTVHKGRLYACTTCHTIMDPVSSIR